MTHRTIINALLALPVGLPCYLVRLVSGYAFSMIRVGFHNRDMTK